MVISSQKFFKADRYRYVVPFFFYHISVHENIKRTLVIIILFDILLTPFFSENKIILLQTFMCLLRPLQNENSIVD